MNLAEISVRRGVTLSMIFLIVGGFGLFSLARLRLDMYPDITFPVVGVITQYTGAGPNEIEDLVTRRIEGSVSAVKGVKKVTSTSKQGASVVMLEFDWNADMDQAEIDVRKHIDFIRGLLPEDVEEPIVFAFDPSMQPVVFLGLSGPFEEVKLREIAEEKVEPLLERLDGIASVDILGGGKREISVQLDPARLGAAKVSPAQVVNALRADNVQLPGGFFDQGGWEFTIQTKGRYTSVEQIGNVPVTVRNGVVIRIRDVGQVIDGLKEATRLVRNDGRSGILIMVRKQSDANTVQAVRAVMKNLSNVEQKAGRGIKLSVIFNQGDFIEKSIGNLSSTAFIAFIFTFLVLLFFLRSLRSSIIVGAAIPFSVVATFSIMDAYGLTLNIISMAGLALAIGMLVDNSIVVLENIFSHLEEGKNKKEAAIEGTKEVATAITASTLTTLVVFLPILFVPGIAGKMFGDMSITICFSLAASLIVARTGIPLAASRLLNKNSADKRSFLAGIERRIGNFLEKVTQIYSISLDWCLNNRKKTFGIVTLIFIISIIGFVLLPRDFFPKHDSGLIIMQMDAAQGTSLEETDKAFRRMEEIVQKYVPEHSALSMDIGTGEGFVALFAKGPHSGIMRLKLKDRKYRSRSQAEIEADLRKRFSDIPGITATVFQPNFLGSEGDIVVEIYGYDLIVARDIGMKIKEIVLGIKGTADVTFSMEAGNPEYEVLMDRSKMAALGLNTATVSSAISTVFAGTIASVYQEGGYEYDIRVRGSKNFREDERNLKGLPIITPTGVSVPLSAIATVRPSVGPVTIARKDQQRMVSISCAVPGKNLGGVVDELTKRLEKFSWPEGFTYSIGGQAEDLKESFKWLAVALLASILLVYMVMASQFESLLHPFLILFTIPLAGIGVAGALLITQTSLSVTALIGILILVGIVVNNAIILIDYVNQLRAKGMELFESVRQAGRRRLRPILMTALTTILGMVPLALEIGEGSESWSPMARTVIGGLTTSTFLTLMIIPTIYISVEVFRANRRKKQAAQ